VLAFDYRGFGRSPLGDAAPSLDVIADDLVRALDARKLDRIVLVGSSMGGYVAMAFLRRHPDRVAGLALLAARATADAPAAGTCRETFTTILDHRSRGALIAETTAALVGATTRRQRPAVLARVLEDAATADPRAVAWAERAIAARPDSVDVLRTARVPAIVIAGDEDQLVRLEESQLAASALPRGRLIRIPDAGHLSPLETPEVVTSALVELLRDVNQAEAARGHAR
jgi:pimeloyl-ACP methyl ester carboxylesterase